MTRANRPTPSYIQRRTPLGIAGTGFAASILMSRPALCAVGGSVRVSNSTATQLTSHIVQLGVYARRDPLLIRVCLAIAIGGWDRRGRRELRCRWGPSRPR